MNHDSRFAIFSNRPSTSIEFVADTSDSHKYQKPGTALNKPIHSLVSPSDPILIAQVSPLPLADWHEGEPNNWDGNEDCVEFVNDGWNDNSCAREKRKFVCMYGPIIDGQLADDFFDE